MSVDQSALGKYGNLFNNVGVRVPLTKTNLIPFSILDLGMFQCLCKLFFTLEERGETGGEALLKACTRSIMRGILRSTGLIVRRIRWTSSLIPIIHIKATTR